MSGSCIGLSLLRRPGEAAAMEVVQHILPLLVSLSLAAALLFVLVGILASLPYQPGVKPRRSLRRRWGVRATGPSPPV
jgi:hypothetical protein